jgi:hypothetical protein
MATGDSTAAPIKQNTDVCTFHQRLQVMLKVSGYESIEDQLKALEQLTGKKPRTVAGWVKGRAKPCPGNFSKILSGLSMWPAAEWLQYGEGPGPYAVKVVNAMKKMTEWQQGQFVRMGIRLMNQDPKALRLIDMYNRGQIDNNELLRLM